jgi:biofilm PGA synthesis lipoprotein PgaB
VHGALHLGYYPDDFPADHPELERIRPGISSATYPYKER